MASMLLPAPCDLPGLLTAFTVDVSKANVMMAAATASELTSRAKVLMFPTRSYSALSAAYSATGCPAPVRLSQNEW